VLATLNNANATRGRELFFDRVGGAGCASCHRVRGQGSDVGPDLSGVGIRLTPENIAKAIIKPSADITEGYALQHVQTESGQIHSGAVIKETSATLTLLRPDGTQINIAAEDVESRKRQNQSVMPTGYDLFGASQLADLTAWLRSLNDGARPADR
jgi:putative heme-binding domain-containing protein